MTYLLKLLLYLDQLAQAVLWRDSGLTISSRCGLALRNPLAHNAGWRMLGRFLNRLQAGHCEMAIQGDIDRANTALKLLEEK